MYVFLRIISDFVDNYLLDKTVNELFSRGLTATHSLHSFVRQPPSSFINYVLNTSIFGAEKKPLILSCSFRIVFQRYFLF